MKQYIVTGMSCAACQARVEKAARAVPGVREATVSLLTNTLAVEGDAAPEDIIKAVVNAGYGASEKGGHPDGGSLLRCGLRSRSDGGRGRGPAGS